MANAGGGGGRDFLRRCVISDLKHQLEQAGIQCENLDVLLQTDRGDVMSLVTPHGAETLELWHRLRSMAAATGYWPVILGDVQQLSAARGRAKYVDSVAQTLQKGEAIAMPQWFVETKEQRRGEYEGANPDSGPEGLFAEVGEWPDDAEPTGKFETLKRGRKTIAFALVPTQHPWEVPAFLAWGGWNDCPYPEVQCAVQRYWHAAHGAVITIAAEDVLEMWVDRPPQEREAALALANEQYIFCVDIVEQGTETLANLAATLVGGRTWFFWWD